LLPLTKIITTPQEKILMPEWAILPINDILGNNGEPVLTENGTMEINLALMQRLDEMLR
jgi:hypothetical protein